MKERKVLIALILILSSLLLTANGLSLEDCCELALQHNLGISAREELLEASNLESKASFTDFLPSIQLAGSYTRLSDPAMYDLEEKFVELMTGIEDFSAYLDAAHAEDPNWGLVEDLYDPSNSPLYNLVSEMYEAGLLDESLEVEIGEEDVWVFSAILTQPIFTGGKLVEKYNISKSGERISELELDLKKEEVILETTKRYWLVVELEAKRELAEKYLETVRSYESDLGNYLEEGIVTENELLKVEVKRYEGELNLLKVENGIALSRMALNQIMGQGLYDQLELSDVLPEETVYEIDAELAEGALQSRPELLILKESEKISGSLVKIARSRYFPNIALTASYDYLNPDPTNSLKGEFGDYWTVGVAAQFELFHWNQRGYAYKASQHRNQALENQINEAEELVMLEINQLQYQLKESGVRTSMVEKQLESAIRNLEQTSDRFKEGLVTSSDVLESQTMWLDSGTEEISARSEFVVKTAELDKAAGRLHK